MCANTHFERIKLTHSLKYLYQPRLSKTVGLWVFFSYFRFLQFCFVGFVVVVVVVMGWGRIRSHDQPQKSGHVLSGWGHIRSHLFIQQDGVRNEEYT